MRQQASAVPVEFCDYKNNVMRIVGRLWVPSIRSRNILLQAKWAPSPLRSNGSRDEQAGEAGPVWP